MLFNTTSWGVFLDKSNLWFDITGLLVVSIILFILTTPSSTENTGGPNLPIKTIQNMVVNVSADKDMVTIVSKDSTITPLNKEFCKGMCSNYMHPAAIADIQDKHPGTIFDEKHAELYTDENGISGFVVNSAISAINSACEKSKSMFKVSANLNNKPFFNHTGQKCPDLLLEHFNKIKPIAINIKTPMSYKGVLQH